MKIKLLILAIALITINACKQKEIQNSENSTTSTKEGTGNFTQDTHPAPTAKQLGKKKSIETKIKELSDEDQKRYQSYIQEVKDAKTGPELARIVEKYKDLKDKMQ